VSDEDLILAMEEVRAANNVNWMDIVRVALKAAPVETRAILARITVADTQIAGIIQQLGRTT
jgi:hypothetical protein